MRSLSLYIVLTISLLLTNSSLKGNSQGDDMYYCMRKGALLSYTNYDPKGDIESKYSYKVASIEDKNSEAEVLYEFQFWDKTGAPLFEDNGRLDMNIHLKDGVTTTYMDNLSKAKSIQDVITKGDVSSIPSELSIGKPINDGAINSHIKGFTVVFSYTDRKPIASEAVTTPAGTFQCIKMTETGKNKIMFSTKEFHIISWYAKGIGIVKQLIYDKEDRLLRSVVLTDLN